MKMTTCFIALLMINSCTGPDSREEKIANDLEKSLFGYIVTPWYPRCLDTIYGGYIADFDYEWTVSETSQEKSLVNQTRHLWTTAFLYEHYPEEKQFPEFAKHAYEFIREHMYDKEYGGFFQVVQRDGSIGSATLNSKTIYGQAFAVHGLAKYYAVSGDRSALDLAIEGFRWMDRHPHDKQYGGYFEILDRAGKPKIFATDEQHQAPVNFSQTRSQSSGLRNTHSPGSSTPISSTSDTLSLPLSTDGSPPTSPELPVSASENPLTGLKEFNSSLHVMEALTELYHVWPDSLLRERLEEMYLLFRDTFIHPDGYLKLYFYPDWTLVPDEEMRQRGGGDAWHTQHITFGHDVETAFLLLEAAHALGINTDLQATTDGKRLHDPAKPVGTFQQADDSVIPGHDLKAAHLAKQLVDHALANGWDEKNGGFYYIGYKQSNGSTTIYDNKKAFWVESEGLNALMLMHRRYPDDPKDYFGKFKKQWEYIDTWLIDKQHGGWYSYGLDTDPGNKTGKKSNNWKTTYHDVRGMVHSIEMLDNN